MVRATKRLNDQETNETKICTKIWKARISSLD